MPLPNAVTATTVLSSGRNSGPPELPEHVPSPARPRLAPEVFRNMLLTTLLVLMSLTVAL
jgi:hypothetical protein